MKIGDLLLFKGYINKKQLHSALVKQSQEAINYDRSVPLGKILIELGYVDINEVTEALNDQTIESKKEEIKEVKSMPTEIGEGSKFTFDLKFIVTIGVVIVSACGLYFSITGQVEDNADEIANIKSMGDLKIISYKLEQYDEMFEEIKELVRQLAPLASDLEYIKKELDKLKDKEVDIPEIDLSGIETKLDNLSNSIKAFEGRLNKLEKSKPGGRF